MTHPHCHFYSNYCFKAISIYNTATFIYSYNCHSNVKIGQYWQKIQANLACFEEILLFLQWLSILCVNLGLLNVDKQTANAELKAEKSKQLSR